VTDVASWLDSLPPGLNQQRRLLEELIDWCEHDPDARWLGVGCSMARGNADPLSDLDVAMGVTDGQVEVVAYRFAEAASHLGELVECFDHRLADVAFPHRRVFAQFADRTQLDLFIVGASNSNAPGTVTLYDPGNMVTKRDGPPPDLAGAAWTWACLGWEALANLGKYLRRGSRWEAYDHLQVARGHFWQLWALAEMAPEPQYGVTSVLDAVAPLPAGVESTVACLEPSDLLEAGSHLVALLSELQARLSRDRGYRFPEHLGRFVGEDLRALRPSSG
jgi:hypothetical protein